MKKSQKKKGQGLHKQQETHNIPVSMLLAVAVNKQLNVAPAKDAFVEWLKAVPSFEGEDKGKITIDVPVTLPMHVWTLIAKVAAVHGQTLLEAVDQMVYDCALDDDFM